MLKEAEMEIEERITLKSECNIHFTFDTSDVNNEAHNKMQTVSKQVSTFKRLSNSLNIPGSSFSIATYGLFYKLPWLSNPYM